MIVSKDSLVLFMLICVEFSHAVDCTRAHGA